MDTTAERVARNQSAFREANERIEAAADSMAHLDEVPLICECPAPACTEILRLPRVDYEYVRRDGACFWVVPGHEVTTVDGVDVARVRERRDRFTIMQKVGEAGELSRQLDPRKPVESGR